MGEVYCGPQISQVISCRGSEECLPQHRKKCDSPYSMEEGPSQIEDRCLQSTRVGGERGSVDAGERSREVGSFQNFQKKSAL